MSPFEAVMLICFGVSWPVAIWKTLKTKSVHGKSKTFLALVAFGYASGMLHKARYNFDWVIFLYGFNFLMVLTELGLCLMYGSRHERELSNANAAADTMFDCAGASQGKPNRPALAVSLGSGAPTSLGKDGLGELPEVEQLPAVAKARASRRNADNHRQGDFWMGVAGDQARHAGSNC